MYPFDADTKSGFDTVQCSTAVRLAIAECLAGGGSRPSWWLVGAAFLGGISLVVLCLTWTVCCVLCGRGLRAHGARTLPKRIAEETPVRQIAQRRTVAEELGAPGADFLSPNVSRKRRVQVEA